MQTTKTTFTKRALCLLLSLIMALGTFVTVTVGNMTLLDKLHIMQALTAYADEEPTPAFYRDGELVGIYNPDYTSTETLKYSFDGVDWYDYELPITIPAYTPTTVYAKIGNNGAEIGDTFESSKLAIGTYTESVSDLTIYYNNLAFDFTRFYDSRTNTWQYSYRCTLNKENGNVLYAFLPNGRKLSFVKKTTVTYENEIYGYTANYANGYYEVHIDNMTYYYKDGSYYDLGIYKIEDNNGNYFTFDNIGSCLDCVFDSQNRAYIINTIGDINPYPLDENLETTSYKIYPYNGNIYDNPDSRLVFDCLEDHGSLQDDKNLIKVTDQAGVTVSSYFYANNRMSKSNDKSIAYNADGRVASIVYDSGETLTYTYYDNDKYYTVGSNHGWITTTEYNDAFQPTSYTDESGNTTTYTYDSRYRLTTESSGGYTTTYTYNPDGTLASESTAENEQPTVTEEVNYTYDTESRVVREQCGNDYTYYTYDANGNVLINATFTPDENFTDPIPDLYDSTLTYASKMVYTYDSNGRVATATDAVENEVSSYQYDTYGNTTRVTTQKGEDTTVTDYTYDVMGNLLTSTTGNDVTAYTYDAAGRTLLVNENGKCTRTLYDDLGRVVQEIAPEDYDSTKEGLPDENTYADANVGQRYHYNNKHQIDYEINRLGVRTDYTYYNDGVKHTEDFDLYHYVYNEKGNPSTITIGNNATPYATYHYDEDDLNKLDDITYGNGQIVSFAYDSNSGKLLSQKYQPDASAFEITQFEYTYDNDGNLTAKKDYNADRLTEYDGATVSVYDYTNATKGSLLYSYTETEEVRDEATNTLTAPATETKAYGGNTLGISYGDSSTAYTLNNSSLFNLTETDDEQNRTSSAVLTDSSENTLFADSCTFDTDGNVTSMTSGGVSTSYVYDSKGRITEYHRGSETVYYTYDSKGQLIREDMNYTQYPKTLTYTYDSRGNVTRVKQYEYTHGSLDELEAVTRLSFDYENQVWLDEVTGEAAMNVIYDAQGNPLTVSLCHFEWTNGRQLDSVSYTYDNTEYPVSSYTYDDEGIRTSATAWGNTLYYTTEDGRITSQYELDGNGDKQNEIVFIYNGDELLAALCSGNVYYYIKNAMGDVIALQDDAGNTLMEYRYNAWGDVTQKEISILQDDEYFCSHNPFTYRSYYYDFEGFGAYYLQSRYYEDSFCRFLNADIPDIALESKDEENGQNLFAYCCNDPVNNVDPTGMLLLPLIIALRESLAIMLYMWGLTHFVAYQYYDFSNGRIGKLLRKRLLSLSVVNKRIDLMIQLLKSKPKYTKAIFANSIIVYNESRTFSHLDIMYSTGDIKSMYIVITKIKKYSTKSKYKIEIGIPGEYYNFEKWTTGRRNGFTKFMNNNVGLFSQEIGVFYPYIWHFYYSYEITR